MHSESTLHPSLLEDLIILRDLYSDLEELNLNHHLEHLDKVIDDVEITLEEEHCLRMGQLELRTVFIGEAGAGKSTLVNMLLGERISPHHAVEYFSCKSDELTPPAKVSFLQRVLGWFKKSKKAAALMMPGVTQAALHIHHASQFQAEIYKDHNRTELLLKENYPTLAALGTAIIHKGKEASFISLGIPDQSLVDLELVDTPPFSSAKIQVGALSKKASQVVIVINAQQPKPPSHWREALGQQGKKRAPIVVITHADKVAEGVITDLRQSYLSITPFVSVIDLRSVIESRPFDRGQQWRSLLEEFKRDLEMSDTPIELIVSREIEGFDQLRYTKAGTEKLLLLPQSGVDVLKPLTDSFDLLREHKPIVIAQEIESMLQKHHKQIIDYKNRLLNSLDIDTSKLTIYTKDSICDVLNPLIEQVIQPHLIDNLIKGSFTVRNLTDAEASFWFTPYAGVFLDDLSSSWLRHDLAKLFKRPIGYLVKETLKQLAPSTSGDAFNQELFESFFAEFDTVTLTFIQDSTVAEWVALKGRILAKYENIDEARVQSPQFQNQLCSDIKESIINHIRDCYTEACENYGVGLEASLQSVHQHQLERIEIVKNKTRMLAMT